MAAGLFLQLMGKVLYTSGSANGVHVYFLLILPALILLLTSSWQKERIFGSEVHFFLLGVGLFLSVCAVSAAWSDSEESVLYVARKGLVIMLYICAVIYLASVARRQHIKIFLTALCLLAALATLISLWYQVAVLDQPFGWRTFRIYRMGYGEWIDLGYPVIAGIYFALFAVIAASLIALEPRSRVRNGFLILAILVMLPYIFLTFSRTSWVAGVVSVSYLLLVFRHRASLILALILGGIFAVMALFNYEQVVTEVTQRQLSGRPTIWIWTWHSFFEHPFLGHGFDHSFWPEKHYAHAHNYFLQVMFEQGLLGLLSFSIMLFTVFKALWQNRENRWVLAAFAPVIYILVVMQVEIQHVVTRPGLFWTIFWFPLAFLMGLINRQHLDKNRISDFDS